QDPLNQWTAGVAGGQITFSTGTNPLRWNSIFNFWFDCDAAPVTGSSLSLDEFDPGLGAPTVLVTSTAPGGLYNENLGPGCGIPAAPSLFAAGSPDRATLGNTTFQLRSSGNLAGSFCGFFLSTAPGSFALAPGCTVYSQSAATMQSVQVVGADASGVAVM